MKRLALHVIKEFGVLIAVTIVVVLVVRAMNHSDRLVEAERVVKKQEDQLAAFSNQIFKMKLDIKYLEHKQRYLRTQRKSSTVVPTKANADPLPLRWWEKKELTWVAVLMAYGDNLERLHDFLGKQRVKMTYCKKIGGCEASVVGKMMQDVDSYLKKMVIAHGGPRIDRNWNNH
jgi:hypothetical protein